MFSLICTWINDLVNNREAGDLRRHRAHYDVTLMIGDQTLNLQNTRHTSLLGLWVVYCKYYRTHWPYYNMSTMHIPQTTLGSRPAYSRVVVAQRDCRSSATSSSDCCTIYETPTPTPLPILYPSIAMARSYITGLAVENSFQDCALGAAVSLLRCVQKIQNGLSNERDIMEEEYFIFRFQF